VTPLGRDFFAEKTEVVARALLGCRMVREQAGVMQIVRIVETEAYHGHDDRASHARFGPTRLRASWT